MFCRLSPLWEVGGYRIQSEAAGVLLCIRGSCYAALIQHPHCLCIRVTGVRHWLYQTLPSHQLVCNCQEDAVHMVSQGVILGTGLKQGHPTVICPSLRCGGSHNLITSITLVTNQHSGDCEGDTVHLHLLHPGLQAVQAGDAVHIIHKHNSINRPKNNKIIFYILILNVPRTCNNDEWLIFWTSPALRCPTAVVSVSVHRFLQSSIEASLSCLR